MNRKVVASIGIIMCIALGIVLLGCTFDGKTQNAATLSSSNSAPSDNPTTSKNTTAKNSIALSTEAQSDSTSPATDNSEKVLPSDTDSHPLSSARMVEDYNTMWTIIEENYPYMGVAERITKKNFQEIKKMYSDKLKKVKNEKEFGTLIDSCLKEFENCGHMKMLSSDEYPAYLKISSNGMGSLHMEKIFNVLNNDVSKRFYNYGEKHGEEIGTAGKSATNSSTGISTAKYDTIQTAYIKIPSFGDPQTKVPILEEFFRNISSYKNCIIDIRGNGGGSEVYWTRGIVLPNLKKDFSTKQYMTLKGEKSADYVRSEWTLYPIKDLDISAMPHINTKDLADMDYYYMFTQIWNKSENPLFKGDFYVLTDSRNYSAAEGFSVFCKITGFATLIGERTGGDGIGIDPMISVLPHSGICIRFSASYGLNADGGSNEEYGTEPDILCKGKDALDVCLKHIKAQITKEHAK